MRKFLPKVFFLLLLSFILYFVSNPSSFISPVRADYNSAYNDFTYNYSKYREAHNNYQVAKSTYGTYQTLTAKQDAVKKLRVVIQARDELVSSYYDLLYERFLVATTIPDSSKNTFFKMKEGEKEWMADHQKKIDAAETLEDLNDAANDFEKHYPQMDAETKTAIGMLLLAKAELLSSRWDDLSLDISEKVKEINLTGEDVGIGERGIVSARNKKDLAANKIEAARNIIFPKENSSGINLFSAQQRLSESLQYLREATNFLTEVLRSVTG